MTTLLIHLNDYYLATAFLFTQKSKMHFLNWESVYNLIAGNFKWFLIVTKKKHTHTPETANKIKLFIHQMKKHIFRTCIMAKMIIRKIIRKLKH